MNSQALNSKKQTHGGIGWVIVLSDIAASTLAITLVLMLIVFSLPQKRDRQDALSKIEHREISKTFKLVTSKPLSPAMMVQTLFTRTAGSSTASRSIDVFADRLVFTNRNGDSTVEQLELFRSHSGFLDDVSIALRSNIWREQKVSLYVFNNQLYNLIHDLLADHRTKITTLNMPRALTVSDEQGNRTWHPEFKKITEQKFAFSEFRKHLITLLVSNSSSGNNVLGQVDSSVSAYQSLTIRLLKYLKTMLISVLFIFAGLAIMKIEKFS